MVGSEDSLKLFFPSNFPPVHSVHLIHETESELFSLMSQELSECENVDRSSDPKREYAGSKEVQGVKLAKLHAQSCPWSDCVQ